MHDFSLINIYILWPLPSQIETSSTLFRCCRQISLCHLSCIASYRHRKWQNRLLNRKKKKKKAKNLLLSHHANSAANRNISDLFWQRPQIQPPLGLPGCLAHLGLHEPTTDLVHGGASFLLIMLSHSELYR